jgi:MFS family permease
MGILPLIARAISRDLMGKAFTEAAGGRWFAWYSVAFLLGAASGGLLFGWLGDHAGRAKAMGWSILCYSILTGASYFATSQPQLLVLRFLASMGVGGFWPNGVSLASEYWAEVSRPMLAGVIGAAANIGVALVGMVGSHWSVTPTSWRWVAGMGGLPCVLGVATLLFVPESPSWTLVRFSKTSVAAKFPKGAIFRPPLLKLTLLGIALGTVPLLGTWGSGKFLIPWADAVGGAHNPGYKGTTQAIWAWGAVGGSLLGGWLANLFGRRATYFVISGASLIINGYFFRCLHPLETLFLPTAFVLGFISTIFFGWLPLYLPELFPTRVRATGTGVTYNFGKLASAAGVLMAGALIHHFQGDYARVGAITSLVYGLGMVVICFAPDTTSKGLRD